MSLSSFFSSFLNVVHADAPEEKTETLESVVAEPVPEASESEAVAPEEEQEAEAEAEAEAEEPEDIHPAVRTECQESAKCAPLVKHFEHCQEKVSSGKGFKGEDCVEELMMHCVDACVAPKLFSKLK